MRPANSFIKHILITRFSAMGDVAMTVPVVRALQEQYPALKITVASRPFFKPFFENIPNVHFFSVDVKGRHKGFLGLIRLFLDLKKLKIDAIADLHNVLRTQVIRFLFLFSGVVCASTDKGRAEKKALTRADNKVLQPLKSMFERHSDTLKKLGFVVDLNAPHFPKKENLSQKIQNITGQKNKSWIGIAPFAQYETKMYPLNLMQQVIASLAPEHQIFLFGGGKKEQEQLDEIASKIPNTVNITGKLTLTEELQLIHHLDVMLSMDSGNGHLAAMLGVPVITLWGNTHPYVGFVPFNQPLANSLAPDLKQYPLLPTSVYGNKKIEGYVDCMKSISPEQVVASIKEALKKGQ